MIQDDWLRHKLADWVTRLREEAAAWATPPVLAAPQPRPLAGRALVDESGWSRRPTSTSPAHTTDEVRNSSTVPLVPPPFTSIVVASTDDPFVTPARAAAFSRAWGSWLVTFARAGHLNADAGFGPWPEGRRLRAELVSAVVRSARGRDGPGNLWTSPLPDEGSACYSRHDRGHDNVGRTVSSHRRFVL